MDGTMAAISLTSSLKNGVFEATLNGEPGQTYLIESSENLQVWQLIDIVTLTGDTFVFRDLVDTNQPSRFYRAASAR
jgi:hypothetical protein